AFIIHVRASLFSLFFLLSRSPHDLHSFPTRRSSDLLVDHHATGRVHTLDVTATDLAGIVNAAREIQADLVVVGPEDPLCMGLADRLREAGIPAVGPGAEAAQLEGSKLFAKRFMGRHCIPTAGF